MIPFFVFFDHQSCELICLQDENGDSRTRVSTKNVTSIRKGGTEERKLCSSIYPRDVHSVRYWIVRFYRLSQIKHSSFSQKRFPVRRGLQPPASSFQASGFRLQPPSAILQLPASSIIASARFSP